MESLSSQGFHLSVSSLTLRYRSYQAGGIKNQVSRTKYLESSVKNGNFCLHGELIHHNPI